MRAAAQTAISATYVIDITLCVSRARAWSHSYAPMCSLLPEPPLGAVVPPQLPPLSKPTDVLSEEAVIAVEQMASAPSPQLRTALIMTCKYRLDQLDSSRYSRIEEVFNDFPYLADDQCVRARSAWEYRPYCSCTRVLCSCRLSLRGRNGCGCSAQPGIWCHPLRPAANAFLV